MNEFTKFNDNLYCRYSKPDTYKDPYIDCKMYNKDNKLVNARFHAYIYGIIRAIMYKKTVKKRHALVIVTGAVGDGKSTIVQGMAALDSAMNGNKLELTDFAWAMSEFINLMDTDQNISRPIIGDEFIQAGGNRGMALTSIGNKLKIGFVTKRFKRNTYFLLTDELKEIPEKLVDMADVYINVKSYMLNNGYFNCWVNKHKIKRLYELFKYKNYKWHYYDIRQIKPDCFGRFDNYENKYIDHKEFDKLKMAQTKQGEEETETKKKTLPVNAFFAYKKKLEDPKKSNRQIAREMDVNPQTVNNWINKIKDLTTNET